MAVTQFKAPAPVVEEDDSKWNEFDVTTMPKSMRAKFDAYIAALDQVVELKDAFEKEFIPAYESVEATPAGQILRCAYGWRGQRKLSLGYYDAKKRKNKTVLGFKSK